MIDKVKIYVLNFFHLLRGKNTVCMKITPWKPLEEAQWEQLCARNEPPPNEAHRRRPNVIPPSTADAEWWKQHAVYENGRPRPCARDGCPRHASRYHHPDHGIPYVTCGTSCEAKISGKPEWINAMVRIGTQFYGLLSEGAIGALDKNISVGIMKAIEPAVSARQGQPSAGTKNPPCRPHCASCGAPRKFFAITFRVFREQGGTAADQSQTQLYEIAKERLVAGGTKKVTSLFPIEMFCQQYTDCEDVADLNEWEFTYKTTKSGTLTGVFGVRKDLDYAEAHGLASSNQGDELE